MISVGYITCIITRKRGKGGFERHTCKKKKVCVYGVGVNKVSTAEPISVQMIGN